MVDYFGYAVALYGDPALIGSTGSDKNVVKSGATYIFRRMNGVWIEEAKLIPTGGANDG